MCKTAVTTDLSTITTWPEAIAELRKIRATKPRQSYRHLHDKMVRGNRDNVLTSDSVPSKSTLQRIFTGEKRPRVSYLIGILYALDVPREQWCAWRDLVSRLETAEQGDCPASSKTAHDELAFMRFRLESVEKEMKALRNLVLEKEDKLEKALRQVQELQERHESAAERLQTWERPAAPCGEVPAVKPGFIKTRAKPEQRHLSPGSNVSLIRPYVYGETCGRSAWPGDRSKPAAEREAGKPSSV
jgi:hypothetical protein